MTSGANKQAILGKPSLESHPTRFNFQFNTQKTIEAARSSLGPVSVGDLGEAGSALSYLSVTILTPPPIFLCGPTRLEKLTFQEQGRQEGVER